MENLKQIALQTALSELSTANEMKKSARNILRGLDQFSHIGADYSTADILFEENRAAFLSRRRGNK